jgi:ATP-dependent helicase/nuclease subunit B
MRQPNVFTIPPGAPFLATFVEAFLAGRIVEDISLKCSPLALARATIYVPTQRAGRALGAEFARAIGVGAIFLPRILPLGGLEESENAALFAADTTFDPLGPPAIQELERRLQLAELIMTWSKSIGHAIVSMGPDGKPELDKKEPFLVAASPAGAFALAAELGELIDEFHIENVVPETIRAIVEDSFDPYWSITTRFLDIALGQWPALLGESGLVDPAQRRRWLVETQIAALAAADEPVIALGSTGAQPTTAQLLAAIARHDKGAVILPGLDMAMSAAEWALVGDHEQEPAFSHPQTILKRLLATMKLARDDVREIGVLTPEAGARRKLISAAMAPAAATAEWRRFRRDEAAHIASGLENVTVLEAPDERIEALALALFMREALETPERTAALVTPDRMIARRVAAELRRYNIDIDDSGGFALATASMGGLARLVAIIADGGLNAVNLSALLAHPLTCLGGAREDIAVLAPLIEIGVLRRPGAGASGWRSSVQKAQEAAQNKHAYLAAQRINEQQWRQIESFLGRLEGIFDVFERAKKTRTLGSWALAHREAIEAICAGAVNDENCGSQELFDLLERLTQARAPDDFDAGGYVALFERIAHETILRGPRRAHPRLKILGPLESRLIDADVMLLAGLDEGVWPPQTETGAFLNRSMRQQLGLSPPERRIGQSAHDFVMRLGAPQVVLARALKREGSPTVASRFLTRLKALAGKSYDACRARGARMAAIAMALDHSPEATPLGRPAPRPPLALRPSRLSVTRIETLRRDPYAIYAEYILGLKSLPELGAKIGPRELGTAIHKIIETFMLRYPFGPVSPTGRGELIDLARAALADFLIDPDFETFHWPRVLAGLDHVVKFENERRDIVSHIFLEAHGSWLFRLADDSEFMLTADADRIEVDGAGKAYVIDYKTGGPPTGRQVRVGWSPQLTLEAAMIEAGAFKNIGRHPVVSAAYVSLKDGGKTQWLDKVDKMNFADVVATHREEALKLLSQFRDPDTPYLSRPYMFLKAQRGDYDHLARVAEWSRGNGEET